MDIQQASTAQSNDYFFDQIFALTVILVGYLLFLFSAGNYQNVYWYDWLFYSRLSLVLASLGSIAWVLYRWKPVKNLDSILWTYALGCQASHGILEGSLSVDFASYTGLLYAISCLTVRTTFRQWLKWFAPIQLGLIILTILSKDASFFSSIANFVDTFSMPIAGGLVGTYIARINTNRFEILRRSLKLERDLSAERQINLDSQLKVNEIIRSELEAARREIQRNAEHKALVQLSKQVSHDIRSPLSALNMLVSRISLSSDQTELIKSVVSRINSIAEDLLDRARSSERQIESHDFSMELSALIEEKRAILNTNSRNSTIELGIEGNSKEFVPDCDPRMLNRIVSNLISNSIESLPVSNGKIAVKLSTNSRQLILIVEDNGYGIPGNVLRDLGSRQVTFGKANGNGIGIYSAFRFLESVGGSMHIQSQEDVGTTVTLRIPMRLGSQGETSIGEVSAN